MISKYCFAGEQLSSRFRATASRGGDLKMVRPTLIVCTALALSACATTPVSLDAAKQTPAERVLAFQQPPSGTPSSIVVTRDKGFLGGGCYYALLINGTLAARFDTGETAKFFMEPGEILLRAGRDPEGKALCAAGQDDWTQRETVLHPQETKYFRLSIDANGKTDIQRAE
ncbi:hypothetical protein [Nevskia soli]|uniref:hypothetical protein n=1 Tax=Nevskia soli TaxID=418856 RepID=UPI0012F838F0|nr:hypothetical protein [Nevskia soli]